MSNFDWKPFDQGGEFVKFLNPGDEVVGKVVNIRVHTFDESKGPVPLIALEPLDGGETRTLAIDKVDLVPRIIECDPQVGDMLAVKFVKNESTRNGTKKIFAVRHKVGERPAEPDPFDAQMADYDAQAHDPDMDPF